MTRCARSLLLLCALAVWVLSVRAGDQGDVIGDDPDEELATAIEWDEIDCDDRCEKKAEARLQGLLTGDLQPEAEAWREELALLNETAAKYRHNRTVTRPDIVRKVQLVSYVGEALLPEPQRDLIVNLTVAVQRTLRTGSVSCEGNCSLDLSGVEAGLAGLRDVEELRRLWVQWHALLAPHQDDYLSVLGLTDDIAAENENPDAESYWLMLAEYPGSYDDARALWREVEPLYLKLHEYVRARLERRYGRDALGEDGATPPYLLGSLDGLDWTNIADIVLGEDDAVYAALQKNLKLQDVRGRKLYELVDRLVQSMGFEGLHKGFWDDSRFNATCHSQVVEFCSSGRTSVMTCNTTTWSRFLQAHEVVMTAVRRQLVREQPYVFMNPNRQSAAQEAAVGLLPLLAASTANLQKAGVLPAELVTSPDAAVSLKLLVALRTLPRLPYYLAADLWRLETLSAGNASAAEDAARSWRQHRQNFSRVGTAGNDTWWDFVPDELMTTNKPYLAKFVGTLLQFQLLELFENKTGNGSTVVKVIQEGDQLKQLLKDGFSAEWPALLRTDLGVDGVDSGPLLRYFRSLEEFLDSREDAARPGNRGLDADTSSERPGTTEEARNVAGDNQRASSIGSSILIGCVTVAIIGIVATVVMVVRRRFQRRRSDYRRAKTNPE